MTNKLSVLHAGQQVGVLTWRADGRMATFVSQQDRDTLFIKTKKA